MKEEKEQEQEEEEEQEEEISEGKRALMALVKKEPIMEPEMIVEDLAVVQEREKKRAAAEAEAEAVVESAAAEASGAMDFSDM